MDKVEYSPRFCVVENRLGNLMRTDSLERKCFLLKNEPEKMFGSVKW